jgi:hypothetical protein
MPLEPCARSGAEGDWWTEIHVSCTGSHHLSADHVVHCDCACHGRSKSWVDVECSMGYPMSYDRLVHRNHLSGDYEGTPYPDSCSPTLVAGDMRRLEADSRDEQHLKMYAEHAGITVEQVKKVLDAFFAGHCCDPEDCPVCPEDYGATR